MPSFPAEQVELGRRRIEWADAFMPVLARIRAQWAERRPLAGVRISACLHVTTETANLVRTLAAGGAEVRLSASNPLSTQDDVVAALNEVYGIPTFARRGVGQDEYYAHIRQALEHGPNLTMDDGADLVTTLHTHQPSLLAGVRGGTEETTTGVIRLRAMAEEGKLRYPIVAVNDARTKHLFDNRYGTGQSAIDGVLRATNLLLAGSTVVVAGYGWCGRGIAMRARGMGARVIVTEVDPLRALEAVMDGYEVKPMLEAAAEGDLFITATGDTQVITEPHFLRMKDGAILANAGHFDVEVDVRTLRQMAKGPRAVRPSVDEWELPGGKRIRVIGEGRLVNLAAAEGHPAQVMDMSFANQALSVEWLARQAEMPRPGVYPVPEAIDREVARLKLESLHVRIDTLTEEQRRYLSGWEQGT
ncbi:adenosylhomocysteinase [Carboxydochorda subterranea]|uniref:Adenosylhomocysteinase n=1 Tax=Carboxydichorda subterranea TaxID=3109565 RepID=A0ABZ1C0M4_9FIRM|nr:adenosylhomocysteinase [Limnochorda sp. L945t]WRP17863.1 adenosylhomocysteinase [Limnochorda sp. L945t]